MVTTVKQARALPETRDRFYKTHRVTDPVTGITTESYEVMPFVALPVGGDEIMFFRDADGRLMEVIYTADGAAKCEARL